MRSNWIAPVIAVVCLSQAERVALANGCPCHNGTETLGVQLSVALSCIVSTTDLSFGDYDPIAANVSAPLDGAGGVSLACTNGYNATVTLGQGSSPLDGSTDAAPLRQMSDGGSNRLRYFLYQDAARTTVWGNTYETSMCTSGNVSVYGRISAGQSVAVGSYTDVVVVTVNI